jgi:hypothetical protein
MVNRPRCVTSDLGAASTTMPSVRRGLSLLVCVIVLESAAACGSSSVNGLQSKSPDAVLRAALAAANKLGEVHYVLQTSTATQKETVTGDATRNEGAQYVMNGSDQIVIQLVGTLAFVRGNVGGLQDTIGLSSTVAARYVGKWISFRPTDSLYQSVVQAVTLRNVLAHVTPAGSLAESTPGKVAGHTVIGVRGTLPNSNKVGTATVWVATVPPTVPIGIEAQSTTGGQSVTELGTFSRWGEKFLFRAPTGAVAFSTLPSK